MKQQNWNFTKTFPFRLEDQIHLEDSSFGSPIEWNNQVYKTATYIKNHYLLHNTANKSKLKLHVGLRSFFLLHIRRR